MRGWIGPLLTALLVAAASFYGGLMAMPYALMDLAIQRVSRDAGMNRMSHGSLPTADRQPVVRPSPDLAYSICPYDLSAGPLEITIVPIGGRYSSLSIFDARTDTVFVRNDVEAGARPYRLVVARPGQRVAEGSETIRVDHDRGIALIRLLLASPAELQALEAARRQSTCRTLTGDG